jgi:hypothetical protein
MKLLIMQSKLDIKYFIRDDRTMNVNWNNYKKEILLMLIRCIVIAKQVNRPTI